MLFLLFACNNVPSNVKDYSAVQELSSLQKELIEEGGDARKNPALSKKIVHLGLALLEDFPEHPKTPRLIFTSAEIARGLQQFQTAIHLWEKIIEHFPDSPYAEKSLFLKAFCYDADLNDKAQAEKNYKEYLALFAEGDSKEEVEILLQMLDTPESELIQMLQNARPDNR